MARWRKGKAPPDSSLPERMLAAGLPFDEAALSVNEEATGAAGTTGARVVRSGLWKMLANTLPQLYTLVLSVAAARYLGASGLGRQSFIAFVEATVITLVSANFSVALMRYVGEAVGAERPGAARWLAARILRIEGAAAVLGRGALRFAAYSFGGTILYLIIWRRSEFFFLVHYSTDRQIAYYSIGFAVATGLVRLPAAMGEVLAPAVATLYGAGAHDRIRTGFS